MHFDQASLTNSQANRRIWSIAWPMILSSVSIPMLGLVDTALLGHLESERFLAAVAIGANFIGLMYWSFGFLRMGTTGLIAQAFGQRHHTSGASKHIDGILFRALAVGFLLGLCIAIITPFISTQIVLWMQASEQVSPLAKNYIDIRRYSAPAVFMTFAISGWLVGIQQARKTLILIFTTNALNVVLDIIFIVYLNLESAGAAWATLISEYVGLAVGCYFLYTSSSVFNRSQWQQWLNKTQLKEMLGVNYYLLLRTIILMLVFNFFIAQGSGFGDVTLAANAILLQLFLFSVFVMDGFSYAAEALCGEAYGGRQFKNFKRYIKLCGGWVLITAAFFSLIYLFLSSTIIGIFSDVTDVVNAAHQYRHWMIALPLAGFLAYLLDGVCIGAGKTRVMYYTMLLSTVGVFFPIWFITKNSWGNHGLWLAFMAFNLARGLSLLWYWLKTGLPNAKRMSHSTSLS